MTRQIMQILADGEKHTRVEMSSRLGVCDRVMRKAVEQARKEGHIILNDQDGTGYYQCADLQALLQYYQQERGRAMSILIGLKNIHRILKEAELI